MNVLKIGDREFSFEELIAQVKLYGKVAVTQPLARREAILACAREREISVSEEALRNRLEALRKTHGLITEADAERWMKENDRTPEDMEEEARFAELTDSLLAFFDRETVERRFAENKADMDAAEISAISVSEREVADELYEILQEEEEDFPSLAAKYSTDSYAKSGGYVGNVCRGKLPSGVAALIFNAKPGDVVAPFEMGGDFMVVLLHDLIPDVLDDLREREIRRELLELMLARSGKKVEWLV